MKQASKIHDISRHEVQDENISENCVRPDPEVLEKKPRRKFTAAYKLRILEEFDAVNFPFLVPIPIGHLGYFHILLYEPRRRHPPAVATFRFSRLRQNCQGCEAPEGLGLDWDAWDAICLYSTGGISPNDS